MISFLLFLAIISSLVAAVFLLLFCKFHHKLKIIFFSLLGISGFSAVAAGAIVLIKNHPVFYQIPLCFPGIALQFSLDLLSGFFLIVIGIIVIATSLYGPGYVASCEEGNKISFMSFFTGVFISSMYLVLIASNVFSFFIFWELMSISSYFLVNYYHDSVHHRKAALIYLLMAKLSGMLILFAFCILVKFSGSMNFASFTGIHLPAMWLLAVFFLSFFGFGMKAGIVPLHVWLPLAHPAAPSHISALMSGVMLKVAIYGFIRFVFIFLNKVPWVFGSVVLFLGIISALMGVLGAITQHDLKKLLAYHSVENIGIIFIALALALIFKNTNHNALAAISFIAALYHCLNHAIFKSLLFFGAGAVLQQINNSDLEYMGGLIKKMPYTAMCFLVGCISISALPPFNGFVSEWLIFQSALHGFLLPNEIMRIFVPIVAALLALTGALATTCFVKVYGVAFLGNPRTNESNFGDPAFGMRFCMICLAVLCVVFGIFPGFVISILNILAQQLVGAHIPNTNTWLWLMPISMKTSSFSSFFVCLIILIVMLLSYLLVPMIFGKSKFTVNFPWSCGFGKINSKMQITATAFSMPIRRVFKAAWLTHEAIEKKDNQITYHLKIEDWIWCYIYLPIERGIYYLSKKFSKLQSGNIRLYLAFVFTTLILLLWVLQ